MIKSNQKKVCFVMGVGQRYIFMHLVADEMIKRHGVEPRYLVSNEGMTRYLIDRSVPSEKIIMLNEKMSFGSWGDDPVDHAFLEKIEALYGIPNLYLYFEAVRSYKGYDHYSAMKMIETTFRVYLDFIEKENFDFALMDIFPANLPMLVMSSIMDHKETPFYFLIPSRIENRFLIVKGLTDKYHSIDNVFDKLKQRDLTESEREAAEKFISKYYHEKRYFSTSEKAIYDKNDISIARLKRGVGALIDSYRYGIPKKGLRKHSNWGPFFYTVGRVRNLIRKSYLKNNKLFQRPVEDENFVLFLLHKQPEATTFVKSPFFMDQGYLIEVLAKSLPVGYSLYIKPHHNDFGALPLSYYKDLVCRPNVKIMMPYMNSQELVRRSSAVITISGTVGWEGIILGKPVITFGQVFYNYFDQVIHVRDVTELPRILKDAVFRYKLDRELMVKYISAHILGTNEGVPLSPIYSHNASLEPENIKKIVDGISKELNL